MKPIKFFGRKIRGIPPLSRKIFTSLFHTKILDGKFRWLVSLPRKYGLFRAPLKLTIPQFDIDQFQIIRKVGSGGVNDIYLAKRNEKEYAIRIRKNKNKIYLKRALENYYFLSRNDPRFVQLHGVDCNHAAFLCEYIPKHMKADLIRKECLKARLDFLAELVKIDITLRNSGIVIQDLCLDNLIIHDRFVILVDFDSVVFLHELEDCYKRKVYCLNYGLSILSLFTSISFNKIVNQIYGGSYKEIIHKDINLEKNELLTKLNELVNVDEKNYLFFLFCFSEKVCNPDFSRMLIADLSHNFGTMSE